ncbi:hypothetical protein V8C44DRAFT_334398 [Trichoderma aethiopicum]
MSQGTSYAASPPRSFTPCSSFDHKGSRVRILEAWNDMDHPPFSADNELCKDLAVTTNGNTSVISRTNETTQKKKDYLPGEPRIQLCNATIEAHLEEELATRELDQLSPYLWLVAKQDSSHISSLTHQRVRGREIVVTEKPGLHLVWYNDRVYIKPLPKYLLSYAFWDFYFFSPHSPLSVPLRNELRQAALGFLRSYSHLVQRRSDFNLAMDESHRLLPKHTEYAEFARLIRSLESVDDRMVSPRYNYGELRLSRLNFWIKVLLFRFTYHKAESQYGLYFARFYGPILFAFGVFSVLLSAMQVVLAVIPLTGDSGASWLDFARVSRGFSVFILFVVAIVAVLLMATFVGLASREIIYALRDLHRQSRSKRRATGAGDDMPLEH